MSTPKAKTYKQASLLSFFTKKSGDDKNGDAKEHNSGNGDSATPKSGKKHRPSTPSGVRANLPSESENEMDVDEDEKNVSNGSKENHPDDEDAKKTASKTSKVSGRSKRKAAKRRKILTGADDTIDDSEDEFKPDSGSSEEDGSSGEDEASEPETESEVDSPVKKGKKRKMSTSGKARDASPKSPQGVARKGMLPSKTKKSPSRSSSYKLTVSNKTKSKLASFMAAENMAPPVCSDGQYSVVEFLKEKAIEVVPSRWIEGSICYWPRNDITKKIKKKQIPDKAQWSQFEIRVMITSETLEQAQRRAKRAVDTSTIETSDDEGARKRKAPARYQVSDHSDDDDGDDEGDDQNAEQPRRKEPRISPPVQMPRPPLMSLENGPSNIEHRSSPNPSRPTGQSHKSDEGTPHRVSTPRPPVLLLLSEDDLSETELRSSPHLRRQSRKSDEGTPHIVSTQPHDRHTAASSIKETPRSGDKGQILQKQDFDNFKVYVRMKFEELAKNQQELISQLKRVASATRGATAEEIDDVHSHPMTTFKEMEEMCEKLRDKDSNFRKMMGRHLSMNLGGHNLAEYVCNMLKNLGTNWLWSHYSMQGKRGKMQFAKLPLCNVIIKAAMKNFKAKVTDVEDEVAEFLRNCPWKPGGTKYKKKSAPSTSAPAPAPTPPIPSTSSCE